MNGQWTMGNKRRKVGEWRKMNGEKIEYKKLQPVYKMQAAARLLDYCYFSEDGKR